MATFLEQLKLQTEIAQEAQKKAEQELAIEQAKIANSKKTLDAMVSQAFEESFLLNEFNTRLTQAWLATQDNVFLATVKIYDRALRNPLLGLQRSALGFTYNGVEYQTIKQLKDELETTIIGSILESEITEKVFAVLVTEVLTKSESHFGVVRAASKTKDLETVGLTSEDMMIAISLGLGGF